MIHPWPQSLIGSSVPFGFGIYLDKFNINDFPALVKTVKITSMTIKNQRTGNSPDQVMWGDFSPGLNFAKFYRRRFRGVAVCPCWLREASIRHFTIKNPSACREVRMVADSTILLKQFKQEKYRRRYKSGQGSRKNPGVDNIFGNHPSYRRHPLGCSNPHYGCGNDVGSTDRVT